MIRTRVQVPSVVGVYQGEVGMCLGCHCVWGPRDRSKCAMIGNIPRTHKQMINVIFGGDKTFWGPQLSGVMWSFLDPSIWAFGVIIGLKL